MHTIEQKYSKSRFVLTRFLQTRAGNEVALNRPLLLLLFTAEEFGGLPVVPKGFVHEKV